ncbi:MAG: glutathione S-transferase family protein [Alsobacter sp.]|nr:glutathione S-transferase [Burkholderiales bacterium]
MADYRLHCFAQSGNAYKVALYLQLAGLPWEPVFVDFFKGGQTRTPQWRESVSAMGEVPVLEHGGRRYTQSGAILTLLAETTGHFAPRDADERYEALRWLLWDNHKFTSYYATLRFLMGLAKTGETPVTEFLRARATAAFSVADSHFARNAFVLGDRPTIADLSMAGYVFYPEETGIDWDAFPALSAWRERIRGLPGWVHPYELMPGHPLPA